ncbi:hypothetical protein BN2476_230251 [Paraburkholderia piptadeniae]|uniref:Uncharacterized protein n=1 Tax=Paraburkholderia piptadeniae TaxID=1701573 RepID=A0A1N7RXR8_9BURK|nr:hypothetical protein BN2476_230251 [Paraburkholderia piptadeniae]
MAERFKRSRYSKVSGGDGSIEVLSVAHGMSTHVDGHTGRLMGARVHRPLCIEKEIDRHHRSSTAPSHEASYWARRYCAGIGSMKQATRLILQDDNDGRMHLFNLSAHADLQGPSQANAKPY